MNDFTSMHEAAWLHGGRVDVLAGPPKRRSYSDAEKARLVAASLEPGAIASGVARRHGVHPQVLYAWRRLAREGRLALPAEAMPMFAPVLTIADPGPEPGPRCEPAPADARAAEVIVELSALRLRIGSDVPPARVAALVAALRATT